MYDLEQFLEPVDIDLIRGDEAFYDRQFGRTADIFSEQFPDIERADVVIVGMNEYRGAGFFSDIHPADAVRMKLYKLFYWHTDIQVADIGNVKRGASLNDSYSCLKTVLKDLAEAGKGVIIIGGSHDLTLGQSRVFSDYKQYTDGAVIDAFIDLQGESMNRSENFLMEMLTGEPSYVRNYNHIGFQSYFVHPYMLETMDKLRFDCFRVGYCREQIEEMEPVMRDAGFISFDLSAIRHGDAPAGGISPNGFTGEEACMIANFAGQSEKSGSFGIYGFLPEKDVHGTTALQIAQMIWYYIDGRNRRKSESLMEELHNFNEYHTSMSGQESVVFLQSKRTGRWWMKLSENKYIACSHRDYLQASNNDISERWLRAQEREF